MSGLTARVSVLLISASIFSLTASAVHAQAVDRAPAAEQSAQPKQKKQKRAAAPAMSRAEANVLLMNARAQTGPRAQALSLDEITIAASKTEERAIDALAPVSVITLEEIKKRSATRVGDLINTTPGVWLQDRGDDPSTSINIRGLQDFGRVAVLVDGARQNYQRTGHFANGSFFLNPELVAGVDIVRGPTANIYGSGAIGGVASFRTKDVQDVVRPGERWGVDTNNVIGTNNGRALQSVFAGVHINPNVDFFAGGTYSRQDAYKDGTNYTVANTGNELSSGIAKLTMRPADGHEIKLGTTYQQNDYLVGQPPRTRGAPNTVNAPPGPPLFDNPNGGTSIYDTTVRNYTTTLGWKYSQPDDKLFDWDAKVYWNRTENDQTKLFNATPTFVAPCTAANPGNPVTGCVGGQRGYNIDTVGFDAFNTSRFEFGDWRHAMTLGVDGFRDEVGTRDQSGNSNVTIPGGVRTVFGGFAQWKANYTSLVEIIGAVRYDNYNLESGNTTASADRFSPKITIGLLPTSVVTPYVSYAEGYRAPALTETLVTGAHATAGGPGFFNCAAGGAPVFPAPGSQFCFLPNPNLRPEVGKNKEIGFNVKKDGIFAANDSFRGKFSVYRNDISDYIDPVQFGTPLVIPGFGSFLPFYQYQNIPGARIEGFEAETVYDAQTWFAGVSGTFQRGKNTQTGIGLYSIPPQKITTTAGVRFAENKGTLSVQWTSVKSNTDINLAQYIPATSYELVNMYLTYNATKDAVLSFTVENLLNQYYRPYAVPQNIFDRQNDVLWASAGAGVTFKGGFRYHFGGT
jgi:hemoglobin/transferrin/lactoferrin receptor protein